MVNDMLPNIPNCHFSFSCTGFWSGILFLIAPFPDHYLLVPSYPYVSFLPVCNANFIIVSNISLLTSKLSYIVLFKTLF